MKKLEVLAIPMYFATMGAEYLHHRSRARVVGELPGDYERRDTLTSLTMGTASLVVPLVAPTLLAPITPGKGRYGKALVAGAVGAAAVTTVADVVVRRGEAELVTDPGDPAEPVDQATRSTRRRRVRLARKVSRVGSVAAVAAGGVAVTTAWGHATRSSALWRRRVVPDLGTGVLAWGVALVGWDALYYWNHRIWHESRFMWANHVMHHSSERYNLSTALRQSVTDPFLFLVPYSSLSLVGVRPEMVTASRSLNLLYQYWVHTDAIDRLGPVRGGRQHPLAPPGAPRRQPAVHRPQPRRHPHHLGPAVRHLPTGERDRRLRPHQEHQHVQPAAGGGARVRRDVPRRGQLAHLARPPLVRPPRARLGIRPPPPRRRARRRAGRGHRRARSRHRLTPHAPFRECSVGSPGKRVFLTEHSRTVVVGGRVADAVRCSRR